MADSFRLAPLPGFDWRRVTWRGPYQTRTEVCSYCGDALDREHSIPLILSNKKTGRCAEFCDQCQATGWGARWDEEVEPRHEPEVLAKRRASGG